MSSTTRTIDQLCLSPLNVRTYGPDAEETDALQASILADGLINPIAVHPMKGNKAKWGAVAGGRRYRAIKALIERGELPADWPVRVNVFDQLSDAELIEHSITENLLRRDLRDHELFAGVARAAARGHDAGQIARNLGQPDVTKVARWLRMGRLAPPIFQAFAAGQIAIDQARAFAATDDTALQLATFKGYPAINIHVPTPAQIRRDMKIGDERAQRELAFVGEAVYREAGGAFELDLFAEDAVERGRVVDEAILRRLVDEKLASVRDQVRATTQNRDLRFVPEPPQSEWNDTDHQLSISPKRLDSGTLLLPDGDVVAHIKIGSDGEPAVSYWWATRTAKYGSEKPKPQPAGAIPQHIGSAIADPYGAKQRADAAIRGEEGISQDAIFAMRALRKVILRAALVEDARGSGTVGQDYLIWCQARLLLADRAGTAVGMRGIAGDNTVGASHDAFALAREHVAATPAAKIAATGVAEVTRERFFTAADPVEAFLAFRSASPTTKSLTAALVAGAALERSLAAPGYEMPVHDAIACEAGAGNDEVVRQYWTPTSDLLDLFPKDQRRSFAEPFVERQAFATWAKLKSSELTNAVLRVLTRPGGGGVNWVHPLLRFRSGEQVDRASAQDAAE